MIKILPSTDPVASKDYLKYALHVQSSGADYLHCDVMDGIFVEKKQFSASNLKELSYGILLPIDVHLMVSRPRIFIEKFLEFEVNIITIHYESFALESELTECLKLIRSHGALAGLAIKPKTKVTEIMKFLPFVDIVLPMSVEPGKSGQTFMPSTYDKYKELNYLRIQNGYTYKIQADGGVNLSNISEINDLGVDMAVVGSALFNAPNKKIFIDKMKSKS